MEEYLVLGKERSMGNKDVHAPRFFRLKNIQDREAFSQILESVHGLMIHDEIYSQLEELIKLRNPRIKLEKRQLEEEIQRITGNEADHYGVWVYYEWSRRLVHLLDEEEFIEVRTNRNKHKITEGERSALSKKKIGVVGLSVGKTISLAMAMERSFGEIRLADYDTLELSNLNRLQTGVHSLGLSKAVIAAREICEIDPFLKVKCFPDGLTEENMDRFFSEGGKLDIVVDECDGLDIKILLRYKAKELRIPVVMDMNDRGTLDVERFDLEPERSLLHGMIDHLDLSKIGNLTNIEKIPYILPMLGEKTISAKLKASMLEMGYSTTTWPQLASSVVLGGAIAADVCRRISLNQFHQSGRYWVDMEEQIADPVEKKTNPVLDTLPSVEVETTADAPFSSEDLEEFILQSPAAGNVKNWKVKAGADEIIIRLKPYGFGDKFNLELQELINAGHFINNLENIANCDKISANVENENIFIDIKGLQFNQKLKLPYHQYKYGTNSTKNEKAIDVITDLLQKNNLEAMSYATSDLPEELLGQLMVSEKVKHLHPEWSAYHLNHYINWNENKQGVDISEFEFNDSIKALMDLGNDTEVVDLLNYWEGGDIFPALYENRIRTSEGFFFVVEEGTNKNNILNLGKKLNRLLIQLNELDISIEPLPALPLILYNELNAELLKHISKSKYMINDTGLNSKTKHVKFIGRII